MSDPQTIAAGITKAFMATDAGRFGICPVCAGIHRLTRSRTLVRHGFKARNVRHGQSSGFHIGGHAGQDPIGTALGNREAVMEAQRHHTTADRLAALPPVSTEEATQAYLQEIWESAMKSWSYRRVGDRPQRYETLADLQASKGWRSVMHWFSEEGLAYKAGRMVAQRAQTIEDHRAHADLLVALVTLNPD
ncbi:hypothetical protein UFOVP732_7 [uncultured Caudovirales phage]|uniref:Uncharacterized protein n=1 Tax=uncultured Caudovirales phage TaxID=2100421 RepID=A0A6J5NP00_9CAUD|nr:hypothetical protein UFOVP732_7 [uncultured Caudovirales phage]